MVQGSPGVSRSDRRAQRRVFADRDVRSARLYLQIAPKAVRIADSTAIKLICAIGWMVIYIIRQNPINIIIAPCVDHFALADQAFPRIAAFFEHAPGGNVTNIDLSLKLLIIDLLPE